MLLLKNLRKIWNKRADGYEADGARLIRECADDLSTYILQQKEILKLIKELADSVESSLGDWQVEPPLLSKSRAILESVVSDDEEYFKQNPPWHLYSEDLRQLEDILSGKDTAPGK